MGAPPPQAPRFAGGEARAGRPTGGALPQEAKPPPPVMIDPGTRYREIGTIKIMAAMFTVLCGVLNILFSFIDPEGNFGALTGNLTAVGGGIGLVGAAMGTGLLAIFTRPTLRPLGSPPAPGLLGPLDMQNLMTLLSPILMIAGAAAKAQTLSVGLFNLVEVGLAFSFALFFLLYVEYLTAVRRFVLVGHMAIQRNLLDFDFRHVVNHYMSFGFILLGVIVGITFGVFGVHFAFSSFVLPDQMRLSVEIRSVYGLAVVEAIVFTLAAMVISLTLGSREYIATVRAISSFSKERLMEMGVNAPRGPAAPNYGPMPGTPAGPPAPMAGQPPR